MIPGVLYYGMEVSMKRLTTVFLLGFLISLNVNVFAQESPSMRRPLVTTSPYYIKNVFLNRIVSTARGYRLEYFNAKMEPIAIYVPIEWFSRLNEYGRLEDGGVKAEIFFLSGTTYPYVSIYWKNGKFSHLKIFAQDSYLHSSWGALRPTTNIDDRFKPDSEPEFSF